MRIMRKGNRNHSVYVEYVGIGLKCLADAENGYFRFMVSLFNSLLRLSFLNQENKSAPPPVLAYFRLLYDFFWVIPRRLNFICQRFGTPSLLHPHRWVGMKMEQTGCSETLAYKIQTSGNYPEGNVQHSEEGE
jgi:hypothetical protein